MTSVQRPHTCTGRVTAVGSLNVDLAVRTASSVSGETLSGHNFALISGGKGANQTVVATRLGAQASMIGRVGDDPNSGSLVNALWAEGIDCSAGQLSPPLRLARVESKPIPMS
ncbi:MULTISPECIES: PfkB family carbohydrate kinase [Burkholderiaceae]|uniref:PfkB family carbohydrate kinase n=1 Tax=Burkholderiaceae TaxID=119060 RepID=UPI0009659A6F|nr:MULTISPECIES: PfkB family carbohydrate kinase [Burkholderiaceae]MCF2133840.1 hypothetical protein [Mycetohabitans sp. B3]MCG1018553.1 hypothetical protein [Mycetohabitans sp. B4]SIT66105.1 pfkB family carbohydrate kinase [Burkholderia sp. b13]